MAGAAATGVWPGMNLSAQTRNATLVIGLDISDAGAITPDPARMNFYTPPLTTPTVYETLITLARGDNRRCGLCSHANGTAPRTDRGSASSCAKT